MRPVTVGFSRIRFGANAALVVLICVIGGCTPKPDSDNSDALTDTAERGPLKLSVSARPKQVWLADPIQIEAIFTAPADQAVHFPGVETFGELNVSAGETSSPRPLADGRNEWRRLYTLRSLSAGEIEIPPLIVKYAAKRDDGREPQFDSELASGTLRIEVRSALTSQDSLAAPRDITGTLSPQRRWTSREWWLATVVGLVAASVIVAVIWLIRRIAIRPIAAELPEVWALRALSGLTTAGWEEPRRRQSFYYRVSEIVRQYIEKKFGMTAPEMTTEEFLNTLSRGRAELPYEQDRLRAFLESCDRVKYAAFQPRREDGDETLSAARAFVHTTAAAALTKTAIARDGSERAA